MKHRVNTLSRSLTHKWGTRWCS